MSVSRLGVFMRTAASHLKAIEPLTAEQISQILRMNERYSIQTMERLVKVGVAVKVFEGDSSGWVQGNNWEAAALRYGWNSPQRSFSLS